MRIEDVTSDVVVFYKGVPLRSVLGPLLLKFFINDRFYFINRANLSNYADDTRFVYSDRDLEVVKFVVKGDLAVVSRWFDDKCEKCYYSSKSYPTDLSLALMMHRFQS